MLVTILVKMLVEILLIIVIMILVIMLVIIPIIINITLIFYLLKTNSSLFQLFAIYYFYASQSISQSELMCIILNDINHNAS